MNNDRRQSDEKPELPTKLKPENTVDTSGDVVCGSGVIRCSGCGHHSLLCRQ